MSIQPISPAKGAQGLGIVEPEAGKVSAEWHQMRVFLGKRAQLVTGRSQAAEPAVPDLYTGQPGIVQHNFLAWAISGADDAGTSFNAFVSFFKSQGDFTCARATLLLFSCLPVPGLRHNKQFHLPHPTHHSNRLRNNPPLLPHHSHSRTR